MLLKHDKDTTSFSISSKQLVAFKFLASEMQKKEISHTSLNYKTDISESTLFILVLPWTAHIGSWKFTNK